jgi:hypothetical protein
MQHFLITFKVPSNSQLTTSGNTLLMFWTIITHLKRDSQMWHSIVLRYSPGVGSCEWVTPRQWDSEIFSPPPTPPPFNVVYAGIWRNYFSWSFSPTGRLGVDSCWCIKPQCFQNFPAPAFHSTVFPDGFLLESKTERYNNILHSILKCTMMRRRRK